MGRQWIVGMKMVGPGLEMLNSFLLVTTLGIRYWRFQILLCCCYDCNSQFAPVFRNSENSSFLSFMKIETIVGWGKELLISSCSWNYCVSGDQGILGWNVPLHMCWQLSLDVITSCRTMSIQQWLERDSVHYKFGLTNSSFASSGKWTEGHGHCSSAL